MTPSSAPRLAKVWAGVWTVAGGGAALAHDAAPTGMTGWDGVLRVAFGVGVTVLVMQNSRRLWPLGLGLVAALAPSWAWLGVAGLAIVLSLVVAESPAPGNRGMTVSGEHLAAPVVGVVLSQGLLRLRPVGPFGTTAVLATLTVLGLLITLGWRRSGDAARAGRSTVWSLALGIGAVMAVVVSLTVGATVAAGLAARHQMAAGATAARAGLAASADGDRARAQTELAQAQASLAAAHRHLHAPWLEPALLVPIVGPHLRAARAVAGPMLSVADASVVALDQADLDALRPIGGTIDLGMIQGMHPTLAYLDAGLEYAQVAVGAAASPWLIPALQRMLADTEAQLARARVPAGQAAAGTGVLPAVLGAESPRRYLVMFAMPAESRELGGLMSTYLVLNADGGRVSVAEAGSAGRLNDSGPGRLGDPERFPLRFRINRPEVFSTNWTGMPDLPLVTEAVAELYPTFGRPPIDGVLYVDPVGIAALMALTGPLALDSIGLTLTTETVVAFLNVGQYEVFDDSGERKDYLTELAGITFERLLAMGLPPPGELARVLGPAVRGGHLQFATLDDEVNAFLDSVHLLGAFPAPDGGDFLSVVQANGEANKIDSFLHRRIDYRVELDRDQRHLQARVEVELHNTATAELPDYVLGTPPDGQPLGTNLVHLSIYTPHQLTQVEIDGEVIGAEAQLELGYNRYLTMVAVPPGERRRVTFTLTGRVFGAHGQYRLRVANQPLIHPDALHIEVQAPTRTFRHEGPLDEDQEFQFATVG